MKICLIGSTRFKETFVEANALLTGAGHLVYSVAFFGHADNHELTAEEKMHLDLVHLRKIQESEMVVLITGQVGDDHHYVGESTIREIAWARLTGIPLHDWRVDRQHLVQRISVWNTIQRNRRKQ